MQQQSNEIAPKITIEIGEKNCDKDINTNGECFDEESTVFVVEVPLKDHNKPEVIEAKENEVKNLEDYDTFEDAFDEAQEKVGSRWVITRKEKHDGQKTQFKAKLVAKGFHEKFRLQQCVKVLKCFVQQQLMRVLISNTQIFVQHFSKVKSQIEMFMQNLRKILRNLGYCGY